LNCIPILIRWYSNRNDYFIEPLSHFLTFFINSVDFLPLLIWFDMCSLPAVNIIFNELSVMNCIQRSVFPLINFFCNLCEIMVMFLSLPSTWEAAVFILGGDFLPPCRSIKRQITRVCTLVSWLTMAARRGFWMEQQCSLCKSKIDL